MCAFKLFCFLFYFRFFLYKCHVHGTSWTVMMTNRIYIKFCFSFLFHFWIKKINDKLLMDETLSKNVHVKFTTKKEQSVACLFFVRFYCLFVISCEFHHYDQRLSHLLMAYRITDLIFFRWLIEQCVCDALLCLFFLSFSWLHLHKK